MTQAKPAKRQLYGPAFNIVKGTTPGVSTTLGILST